jgi:hypothetical protein
VNDRTVCTNHNYDSRAQKHYRDDKGRCLACLSQRQRRSYVSASELYVYRELKRQNLLTGSFVGQANDFSQFKKET